MIYFISDTHFGHAGSLKWNNGGVRPGFSCVKEVDDLMIKNWNETVCVSDTVYFLGDFAYKCGYQYAQYVFNRLNGDKHLIRGNHDYKIAEKLLWSSKSDILTLTHGIDIVLCHYPMLSWKNKNKGSIHLHGHTHGSINELNAGLRRMDVSVECINYTPISITDIIKICSISIQ